MSRSDFAPDLAAALDRFDAPALRGGFADRVIAAASAPVIGPRPAPRRDRRGMWKRGRQVVIGTFAMGLLSAAAVASGLLGAAGIRVPVLTAMLAPESVVEPVQVARKAPPKAKSAKPSPALVAAPTPLTDPGPLATGLAPRPFLAARIQRQAQIRAFAVANPEAARAILMRRVQQQAALRTFVANNPEVARAIAGGPQARQAFIEKHPEVARAIKARVSERRAAFEAARSAPALAPSPVPDSAPLAPPAAPAADRLAPPMALVPAAGEAPQTGAGAATPEAAPEARATPRPDRPQMLREMRERRATMRELRQLRRQRQR